MPRPSPRAALAASAMVSPAPQPGLGSEDAPTDADSFCRRHLDGPGGGAAKAVGPIHVLHIGLRVHVASGRDGAHHIGDGEHRRIAALALEGRAEAVITEL